MSGKTGKQCDHRFGRGKTGQEEEEEQHIMLEKTHASHVKQSSVDKDTGSGGRRRASIEKATAIHS